MRACLVLLVAIPALLGCEPTDQSPSRGQMRPGIYRVTDARVGTWNAPGGPKCLWWVENDDGKRVKQRRAGQARGRQYVGLTRAHSRFGSDGCGVWTR